MRWAEVTFEIARCSPGAEEAVVSILLEEGAGGIASESKPEDDSGAPSLTAYFPVDDNLGPRIQRIRRRIEDLPRYGLDCSPATVVVRQVDDEEWLETWKKFFKPIVIGKLIVKPSWEDVGPQDGRIVLELDPGMAFGTGSHPTTMLCLELLQDYVRPGSVVLDIGTGSGILAIAAALLGAAEVIAVDCDPIAVEAAVKNVSRNGLQDRVRVACADSIESIDAALDVVVANIETRIVASFAPDVAGALVPGGVYIASGISGEHEPDVARDLEAAGLRIAEARRKEDWAAVVGEKPAAEALSA